MCVIQAPLLDPETREAIPAVDVEKEVEELRRVLKESGQHVRFRGEVATVANFSDMLTRGCRILHYTGHGLESGELAFENEQGEVRFSLVHVSVLIKKIKIKPLSPTLTTSRPPPRPPQLHRLRLENLRELLSGQREAGATQQPSAPRPTSGAPGDPHPGVGIGVGAGSPAALAPLVSWSRSHPTQVAFVSACHSAEAGEAFVGAGVPHVIAVRLDSTVDPPCNQMGCFSRSFSVCVYSCMRERDEEEEEEEERILKR